MLQGNYTDLTPNWYKSIGKSMVIAVMLNIPIRALELGIKVARRKLMRRKLHKYSTQAELNDAFQGPEFTLADRYAELQRCRCHFLRWDFVFLNGWFL